MSRSTAYRVLLASVSLWCFSLVIPPVVASVEGPSQSISSACYDFFSPICHQYDSRSIHLFGHKLGVCGRCSAIYFGFLLGAALAPFLPKLFRTGVHLRWLLALTPMALDVGLDVIGIHASTLATRIVTGGFFGIVAASLLGPLLLHSLMSLRFSHTSQQDLSYETKTR